MRQFTICQTGNGNPPPKKPPVEEPLKEPVDDTQAPTKAE